MTRPHFPDAFSRSPACTADRPLMLAAVVEKATFAIATIVLYAQGRLHAQMLAAGLIDLTLGVLFLVDCAWPGCQPRRVNVNT